MWYASSCSGTTDSSGVQMFIVAGIVITWSLRAAISVSPSVTTLMILPCRARTSCTLPTILS